MSFVALATAITIGGAAVAGAGAVAGATQAGMNAHKNRKSARIEAAKARRYQQQLDKYERERQPVINQADAIRAMKGQVNNPAAQLGIAMQATNLKIAETDKALANTLDSIAAMGEGAGNATALAQMAASSKAEVGAQIEVQETENQKLRIQGEAKRQQVLRDLETTALAEEVSAFDRQDKRDVSKMNRLAGQGDNAAQASAAYDQMAMEGMEDMWAGVSDVGMAAMDAGKAIGS
tara:strand:- start:1872 stop:2576 length:705 start_codon:yes stop_codon:yes gene_type:complete